MLSQTMINPETKEDLDKPVLLFSGLEDAYIGTVEQYGRPPVACYSKQMTIDLLQKNYNLTRQQAYERYEYEYLQTNFWEGTPCFLDDLSE